MGEEIKDGLQLQQPEGKKGFSEEAAKILQDLQAKVMEELGKNRSAMEEWDNKLKMVADAQEEMKKDSKKVERRLVHAGGFDATKLGKPADVKSYISQRAVTEHQKATQERATDLWLAHGLMEATNPEYRKACRNPREAAEHYLPKVWGPYADHVDEAKAADGMDSTDTGYGDEWVFTFASAELIDLVRNETVLEDIFPTAEIPQGRESITRPLLTSNVNIRTMGQGTAETSYQKLGTDNKEMGAIKTGVLAAASSEMTQDSILPWLPTIRQNIVTRMAEGRESIILNQQAGAGTIGGAEVDDGEWGGTAGNAIGTADPRYGATGLGGLRYHAHSNSYTMDTGDSIDALTLLTMNQQMGKPGGKPNGVWVVSNGGLVRMMGMLSQAGGTAGKPGVPFYILGMNPEMLNFNNQVASFAFRPVVLSGLLSDQQNTSGIYDNTTKTHTSILYAYVPAWATVTKGGVTFARSDDFLFDEDQIAIRFTQRFGFHPLNAVATEKTVYLGYNIGITG